jgi:moderate conductance mechanosensitive channel
LIENQYSVGNVVRIGAVSGSVEDISLRITVLRDEEGIVHFIPHSQVTVVSNLTYGWSRAVFNIRVAYDQDIEKTIDVLLELARELKNDPLFGPQVLGEPEMLGIDSMDESGVVVKFLVKTRPLKQWSVKRELLRRIKRRFDKLGISRPSTVKS